MTGDVRVRLDHGTAVVAGRRSPSSLYDQALATYDEGDAFDHASAVGFIEIFGLPLRTEASRRPAGTGWTRPILAELPTEVVEADAAAAGAGREVAVG